MMIAEANGQWQNAGTIGECACIVAVDVTAKVCSGSLSGFIDFVFSPEIPDASVFQMCLCRQFRLACLLHFLSISSTVKSVGCMLKNFTMIFVLTNPRNCSELRVHVFKLAISSSQTQLKKQCKWSLYRFCLLIFVRSFMTLYFLYHTGTQNKSSIQPNFFDSLLPGICKESISSALDLLEQNHEGGKSIADHLLINLFTISSGVSAISKAYEQQEEECQKNCKSGFCNH